MLGKLLITLLAAGASVAARAQEADVPKEEPSSSEIIVQAINPDRQIRDFVEALTDAPIGGQLSRFSWAVCPAATGLPHAQNEAVRDRMRRVARAAAIPVAGEGCRPNVLLIAVPDKKALIEGLYKTYPAYFSGLSRDKVRGLASGPGPAAAWHVEGKLSADGELVPREGVGGPHRYEGTRDPSRLSSATRPHFITAAVVVEHKALTGLTTTQLADYAAMRAFARTDPERLEKATAPSILTVLEAPMGSSDADHADPMGFQLPEGALRHAPGEIRQPPAQRRSGAGSGRSLKRGRRGGGNKGDSHRLLKGLCTLDQGRLQCKTRRTPSCRNVSSRPTVQTIFQLHLGQPERFWSM